MALQPVISFSNAGDCSTLYLLDTTGAYSVSNPGGYGTPNATLSQVTLVTITGTYYAPDGTTTVLPVLPVTSPIKLYPTTANPSPFILNEIYAITPAMLGFNGATLPDGIYSFTMSVTANSIVYTSTATQYLFDCNAWCCVNNTISSVDPCDCGCENGKRDVFFYRDNLEAAEAAVGCLKNSQGLSLLNIVSQWCANNDCGCS